MPSSPTPLSVGLVFGGASGEHAVSIRSARTVLEALRTGANGARYATLLFYIDRQGRWWPESVASAVLASGLPKEPPKAPGDPPESARPGFLGFPEGALDVEVWLPVLHGPNGEDGTIQGLFTLMQRPFVGSGVLGSAVGMDKQAMKAAFAAAGLPQVPYACLTAAELEEGPDALCERLEASLGYPCFIKPANLGSSVGISKASNRAELLEGLRLAATLDPRLVVEQGVDARELECGVLGVTTLRASVLGEICFDADWYDYDTKYSEGLSHTVIPAQVSEAVSQRARALALDVFRAVGASGLARVDFFFNEERDELWVNEINTFPGFTSQSMYPMLWAASGLPLEELIHTLVTEARESFRLHDSSTRLSP